MKKILMLMVFATFVINASQAFAGVTIFGEGLSSGIYASCEDAKSEAKDNAIDRCPARTQALGVRAQGCSCFGSGQMKECRATAMANCEPVF